MYRLIEFLLQRKHFFLFLLLEAIALTITISHFRHHNSLFVQSTGDVIGGLYDQFNYSERYLNLQTKNEVLADENARLKNLLAQRLHELHSWKTDSIANDSMYAQFDYTAALVVSNSYRKRNNFIIINKGSLNGIHEDMGVISSQGMVGIITSVSEHYAIAMSLLNQKTSISARIDSTRFFGPLTWEGDDPHYGMLHDIPQHAELEVGQAILCDRRSTIFPDGTPIGTIADFKLSKDNSYYDIKVAFDTDFTNLNHVMIIHNKHQQELELLNEQANAK